MVICYSEIRHGASTFNSPFTNTLDPLPFLFPSHLFSTFNRLQFHHQLTPSLTPFFSPTQPHPALSTLLPNAVPSHNSHKHSHPISPLPNLTILDAPIIIFPLPDPLYPFLPPSQLFSNLHQPHLPMLPPQFTPNILPFTSSSLPPSFITPC
jgi:hypothetical protein